MHVIEFSEENDGQFRKPVMDFLIKNEKKCVSLTSRFLKKDTRIFCVLDGACIAAVLSFSAGGQILHALPDEKSVPAIQAWFAQFMQYEKKNLFSIIGEKNGTEAVSTLFFTQLGLIPRNSEEYVLMSCDNAAHDPETQVSGTADIFQCADSDFESVFPLQKSYEIEEVLFDKKDFNETYSRILLRRAIASGFVYAVRYKNQIVAKISVNAYGIHCVQIGGVYTVPDLREKGFASKAVRFLCSECAKNGKTPVLFVKQKNTGARGLYKKCGFSEFGRYKICYY